MADLVAFSDPSFQPKDWINAAVSRCPEEEALDRYLAEVEMKLQLTQEDVEATFQECGLQAVRHITAAAQDVSRVHGDAQGIQDNVLRVLRQLQADQSAAAEAVTPTLHLDTIKRRMEAACSTLKEATELSELFSTIDEVFAAGDLLQMADMVATMRRSLDVVGDVPEFRGGRERLASYEADLQSRVEPSLGQAIADHKTELVQQLWSMLASTGVQDHARLLYCSTQMREVVSAWDSWETAPGQQAFQAWLTGWLDGVLAMVGGERRWLSSAMPDRQPALLMSLVEAVFAKVCRRSFKERLQLVATSPGGGLEAIIALQEVTVKFAVELIPLLEASLSDELHRLVILIFSGFEYQINRYPEAEGSAIRAALRDAGSTAAGEATATGAGPAPSPPTSDAVEALLQRLSGVAEAVFGTVGAAVKRCQRFTGGTSLPDLLPVLDDALVQHLSDLQAAVHDIKQAAAFGAVAQAPTARQSGDVLGSDDEEAVPGAHNSDEVTSVLQLLVGVDGVCDRLVSLQGASRAAVASLGPLQAAAEGELALAEVPLPLLRLKNNQSTARSVAAAVESVADPAWIPLPTASSRCNNLRQAVHQLVEQVLLQPVRSALARYSEGAVWLEAADNAFQLPTFHQYPLGAVTAAGEYLMMLPQQLECLMVAEGEGDDEQSMAGEWLDRAAAASVALYTEQVLAVTGLSPSGAAQLAADVEYFVNVINALGAAVPSELATVMLLSGLTEEELRGRVEQSREFGAGELHDETVQRLCKMRGIELELKAPAEGKPPAAEASEEQAEDG